ncbi:uncharacterized protein LOC134769669 [Penaeus indicus]|uniref:uncharacterized protein LOC134769669 n=1 Tax=Penaeus indicus TaxID=29960 RepID=UPI00300CEB8B
MKSNQRWLKLRTTVQLSGALSSSMNRAKPPLKREDSFIKRFSTRQIAELQDTVDQTDEEDVSKNSTGSPKIRKKKKQRQPRTVINPYGNVFFYWLCSLTICVLYNLWTPIVRQAFPELQRKPQPMWYLLDGLTDIVFVVDIFVQFRTGYLEQGLIVYDFKKLARHYMQSKSFMLDIVSLIPLDFLQIVLGPQPLIRFPRFIKVYRVYNYYYMVESRTLYPNMWRVVNLIHILLLLAHWFGCFYYMLSEAEQFVGEWTYPYDSSPDFQTLSRMYLGSVYWSTLTLTTIGDLPTPETNRQLYKESELVFRISGVNDNAAAGGQARVAMVTKVKDAIAGTSAARGSKYHRTHPCESVSQTESNSRPVCRVLNLSRQSWGPHPQPLVHPSFPRAGPYGDQVKEGRLHAGPTSPDPDPGGTALGPAPKLTAAHSSPRPRPTDGGGDGDDDDDDDARGVSPARPHPFRSSPPTSGQPSPDGPGGGKGGEPEPPKPGGPRALPRRGLKSRLLRIKTNAGYIFTIVSYLIGVFIFATIVGQVGNVITNRNANRLEFERLLDGAKLYMRHHKVPRAMQRRVQRWYDYSWSRGRIQGGGDINTALGLLPDKLKTELALHVNLLTLKKVSIFKECQPEFLHDLVLKMKAYIFTPGDLICRKGEVAREMFIIADGILEVISETGKVLTTMKAGDFFGEIGILNLDGLNKRTADVRSVGYSELFSLSREDVLMAMKDYPEAQEILQSLGRKRLMEARHQASKSGSSGSSKRGTPSPNKESGLEDKNAKKIVSRLRSDVTAIRNAFRRSKGTTRYTETLEQDHITERSTLMEPSVREIENLSWIYSYALDFHRTRDNETLELEPLTAEHRASLEDEAPVKRILKLSYRLTTEQHALCSSFVTATVLSLVVEASRVNGFTPISFAIVTPKPKAALYSTRQACVLQTPKSKETVNSSQQAGVIQVQKSCLELLEEALVFLQMDLLFCNRLEGLRISGRSGSDSSTGTRGVLKRMARVTSDEVTQAVSPGRVPSNEEPQGVLGAGLPLLQRLKLLKEKEEREEKERQKKPPEPEKKEPEKEPQVIGAGLPLFARLRLLQAKEEHTFCNRLEGLRMERIEKEEREKAEEDGSQPPQEGAKEDHPPKPQPERQVSVDKEGAKPSEAKPEVVEAKPRPGGLLKGRLRAAVLTKAPPPTLPIMEVTPSGEAAPPPVSADKAKAPSPTAEEKEKADAAAKPTVINDLNKGVEKKSPEGENGDRLGSEKPLESKDIHANSNSVQGGQALERAFGKLLSKKLNTAPKERTSPTVIENPVDDGLKVQNTTSKEKISRSDSFKRAMDEGLIRSTEEPDLNIKPCEEPREAEAAAAESEADAPTPDAADKKAGESQSENEASPQSETKEIAEEQALEAEKKLEAEGKERLERLIRRCGSERRRSSSPKLARTLTSRQHHRVDSLKVPSDDVSPPLSSPESTETPERKSLKSILKRMSREDSRGNLLPPDGADLRKLMKAPTVEGFVARRSKLSKSVSFQRKTLASPPPPALLDELKSSQVDGSGNGAPLITSVLPSVPSKESAKESRSATTDGVNKLMAKLGSMGLDGSPDTQTQDLVLGVRKILRDKMDDVEVAWVQRVEELQQQVAARDATIRHLTHTISRLQASVGVEPRIAEGSLPAGELVPCPSIIRSSSSDASTDGSDDDEPLFMSHSGVGRAKRLTPKQPSNEGWTIRDALSEFSLGKDRKGLISQTAKLTDAEGDIADFMQSGDRCSSFIVPLSGSLPTHCPEMSC